MEATKKELSIGEVGVINGKTVLCVETPMIEWLDTACFCDFCAFRDVKDVVNHPECCAKNRTDKKDVYYPEIKKGL